MKSNIVISEVVNNKSKQQDGRIQIKTPIYDDNILDEHLPWAFPITAPNFFFVPEIGSKVYVNITDVNEPFYLGTVLESESIDAALKQDYPNTIGYVSQTDVKVLMNNQTGELEISAPNGIKIEMDVLANIKITTQRGDISLEGNNINLIAKNDLKLEGKDVEITGKEILFVERRRPKTRGNIMATKVAVTNITKTSGHTDEAGYVYPALTQSVKKSSRSFVKIARRIPIQSPHFLNLNLMM